MGRAAPTLRAHRDRRTGAARTNTTRWTPNRSLPSTLISSRRSPQPSAPRLRPQLFARCMQRGGAPYSGSVVPAWSLVGTCSVERASTEMPFGVQTQLIEGGSSERRIRRSIGRSEACVRAHAVDPAGEHIAAVLPRLAERRLVPNERSGGSVAPDSRRWRIVGAGGSGRGIRTSRGVPVSEDGTCPPNGTRHARSSSSIGL